MSDSETINKLAEVLGQTGDAAINAYTGYYVYNSIMWVAVGFTIALGGLIWKANEEWDFPLPPKIIKWIVVFIGILFIAANFPDVFNPKAMAIHQLIKDVRG